MEDRRRVKKIGRGTFSNVFRVPCKTYGYVVQKDYKTQETTQLKAETTALSVLKGQGVPELYYVDEKSIVMEYIPKKLVDIIDDNPQNSAYVLRLAKDLLKTVGLAHEWGIIHTDIKPSNILLGADYKTYLCDWGSSVEPCEMDFGRNKNNPNSYSTLWYRAPELLVELNKSDEKVDIWSIGCVLYETLMGQPFIESCDEDNAIVDIIQNLGKPKNRSILYESPIPEFRECMSKGPEIGSVVYRLRNHSDAGKFILNLLETDPGRRPTAAEALELL